MTPEEKAADQAAYNRASDIAHEMIASLPVRVLEADADPIDAAYALWGFFTRILLENGWTACDLSEDAHEIAEEVEPEINDDDTIH